MSWLKIDDRFTEHPKVLLLTDGALAFWLKVACWLQRNPRVDGFIPLALLPDIARKPREDVERFAMELVNARAGGLYDVGLWEPCEGGFRVHDWQDYQLSAEESEQRRVARAEAGRLGGLRSGESRRADPSSRSKREASASDSTKQNEAKPKQTQRENEAKSNPDPDPDPLPIRSKADDVDPKDLTGSAVDDDIPTATTIVSPPSTVQSSIGLVKPPGRGTQEPQGVSRRVSDEAPPTRPNNPRPGPYDPNANREPGQPPRPRMDCTVMLRPHEWSPSEHGLAYAREKGLSAQAIDTTLAELRNKWGSRAYAVDWWDAKWVTFVETRAKSDRGGRQGRKAPGEAGYRRQPDAPGAVDFSRYRLPPEEASNG